MCATHCNNVMPIHLEIKQRKLVIKGWLGISRTGACGLPHYCIPLVCVPNIHGGFVVWRLNQPKQEGICKRNTAVQCRLPTHCATKHVFKSEKCSQVSDFVWPSRTTQVNLLLLRQHSSMEQHDHRLLKLQDDVSRERDVPPPLRSSPRYRLVGGVGQHRRKHY